MCVMCEMMRSIGKEHGQFDVEGKLYKQLEVKMVVDGYTSPITAGNFVDLVRRENIHVLALGLIIHGVGPARPHALAVHDRRPRAPRTARNPGPQPLMPGGAAGRVRRAGPPCPGTGRLPSCGGVGRRGAVLG